jgi:hypothetical protein
MVRDLVLYDSVKMQRPITPLAGPVYFISCAVRHGTADANCNQNNIDQECFKMFWRWHLPQAIRNRFSQTPTF